MPVSVSVSVSVFVCVPEHVSVSVSVSVPVSVPVSVSVSVSVSVFMSVPEHVCCGCLSVSDSVTIICWFCLTMLSVNIQEQNMCAAVADLQCHLA